MTYDTRERSVQDGAPVELYEFRRGTIVTRWTSSGSDKVVDGNTYTAAPLQRSAIETSTERARNAIKVTCARDFPIAAMFRISPPTEVIMLTVKRLHDGDTDVAVIWIGRVVNCEWPGGGVAVLNCEPVSASLRRPGLRRKYQRQCPHMLYSQGRGQCNVDKAAHAVSTTVAGVSGLAITVGTLPSKPFAGGFVEWERPDGALERRWITKAAGSVLTVTHAMQGLANGAAVTVYPGCNHTQQTCIDVYSNGLNYGGFPLVPAKNPFDGTPVF